MFHCKSRALYKVDFLSVCVFGLFLFLCVPGGIFNVYCTGGMLISVPLHKYHNVTVRSAGNILYITTSLLLNPSSLNS